MIRNIIHIEEEKCNGCGACVAACHEGAIALVQGKARLIRESFCDGLGDCLPSCPMGAISFEKREAPAYDEASVLAAKNLPGSPPQPRRCPGAQVKSFASPPSAATGEDGSLSRSGQLSHWPVQIKLVPDNAPWLDQAHLLVAADCTAYAYGNFHREFLRNRVVLVGCPKLDSVDYSEKLTRILCGNRIRSITVVRMEVPCCGGIESAVRNALILSGASIPLNVVTVSTNGELLD